MLNKYAILRFGVCVFIGCLVLGCDRLSVDYDRIALECGGSVDRDHEYFAVKNAQGQMIGMSSDTTKVYKKSQAYAHASFSPNGCVHVPRNELPLRLKIRSELISLDLDSKEPGPMHYVQAERFDGQFKIQETCPGSEINGGLGYDIEPAVWIPEAKLKLQVLDAGMQVRAELPMDASAELTGQFNLNRQRLKAETGELSEGDYGIQLQVESDLWEKKVYPTLCRLAIDHTPPKLGPVKLGEVLKAGTQELVVRAAEENVRLFYQITENAEEHSCQTAMSQSLVATDDLIPIPKKPGKYFYSIWAVDKAQNCSAAQNGSFIADDQAPPMPELIFKNKKKLADGTEAEVVGAGAILELSSSEKNVSFSHCWQKVGDPAPCIMEPASGGLIKVPEEGHYQLHTSSRDAAGWESATTIVDVFVDAGQPEIQVRWHVADMNESHKFIHLPYAKIEGQLTIQENFAEIAGAVEAQCSVSFRNKSISFSRDGVSCQLVEKSCAPLVTCPSGTRHMKVELDFQSLFNKDTQKSEWSQLDKGKMNIKVDVIDGAGNRTTLSHEVRIELFPWVPIWALTDHRIQGLIDGSWPLMAMRDSYVVDKADWVWMVTNLGVLAVTRNDIKTFIDHRFFNQKVEIVSAKYSVMQDPDDDRVWVSFKNQNRFGLAVYDRQQGWSRLFDNMDVSGMDAFMTLVGKRGDSLFIKVGSNSTWKIHEFDLKQLEFVNVGEDKGGAWAWNGLFVKDEKIFQANVEGPLEIQSDLPPLKQLWNQGEDLYLQAKSNHLFRASFEGGVIKIKDEWTPQPALGEEDWVHHVNGDKSFWSMNFDNFPALALNYENTASLFSPYRITNRRNGEQWFSDFDLGILEFSPVVMTSEIHTPKDCSWLPNSMFVVTDEQDLVFVCDKQLLQVDSHGTEQKVHSLVPLDYINTLSMTKDGSLLASNPDGVVRYDAKSRTWKDISKNEDWYVGIGGNMHEGFYSLVEHGRFWGRGQYRLAVYDETTFELKHDPIVGVEIEASLSLDKPKSVFLINDHEAYFFHEFKGSYFLRKIRHENSSWVVTKTWELESGFTYSMMNVGERLFMIRYLDYKIHSMQVIDQDVLKPIPDSERFKGYSHMRLLKSLRRNTVYALSGYNTEAGIYEITAEGVKRIGLNEDSRAYFNSTFIDSKKRIWGLGAATQYIAERP